MISKTIDSLGRQIRRNNLTRTNRVLYKTFIGDRRCIFDNDLSNKKPHNRVAKSSILQFYDRIDNIGNYLPVLGIRQMLSNEPDTWDIHDKNIDFDFINKNYKGVIIGGAGLICAPFNQFWLKFLNECKLPTVIWGVGSGVGTQIGESVNIPQLDANYIDYIKVVSEVSKRCDLVNVRDKLTASYFNLYNPHISACPTIVYLQEYNQHINKKTNDVLYSSHDRDSQIEKNQIKNIISQTYSNFKFTDNVQHPYKGLKDIIENCYLDTQTVVTTRLHGAIIAYGLGIPYIGITRGEKIRSFCNEYGNGLLVESLDELEAVLREKLINNISLKSIDLDPVFDFGYRAKKWMLSLD